MASEQKRWPVMHVLSIILTLKMVSFEVNGNPQIPCYFIFGDSLVDNGNNNRMLSMVRANYFPYGIDFPGGATGRFSNGKTVADAISELLGFDDYIPSYAKAKGRAILTGVNYASAGAGIRDETGRHLGARVSFSGQVNNYKKTVSQVANILGSNDSAANHLRQCIHSIVFGSNDYLNNYLVPKKYQTSRKYTPEQYASVLIQQYSELVRELYNYGARKFVLHGNSQIGCTPNALAINSTDGSTCDEKLNSPTRLLNNKLISLVDNLNRDLPDAKFIYINNYQILEDLINNPQPYGFTVTNAACCGVGKNKGEIICLPAQIPCKNRDQYLFWDAFHPTEAANKIVGRRSYSAQSTSDAYPMDIRQLALL